VNEALLRYGASLARLLCRAEPVTLVVLHQFGLRRIVQAAAEFASPTEVGFGTAVPYFLDEHAVRRAATSLESAARPLQPEPGAA
jgi:hypothetical protein